MIALAYRLALIVALAGLIAFFVTDIIRMRHIIEIRQHHHHSTWSK